MTAMTKVKILSVFKEAAPLDISIAEVSRLVEVSDATSAMYIRILEAEKKIRHTRVVGRSKMFQYIDE